MLYNFVFKRNPFIDHYTYNYKIKNGYLLNERRIRILHLFCIDNILPNDIRKLFPEQLVVSNIIKYYLTDDYINRHTKMCFKLSCKKRQKRITDNGLNPFSKHNLKYNENGKSELHLKIADIKREHDSFNLSKKNRKYDSNGNDIIIKKLKESGKLGYFHYQRKHDINGKDIATIKCNITRTKNCNQPFSRNNITRMKLDDFNSKKYGTPSCTFGYWSRTEFNNDIVNYPQYYLSNEDIQYHNTVQVKKLKETRIQKNLKLYGTASPGGGYWKATEINQDKNSQFYISKQDIIKHNQIRCQEVNDTWYQVSSNKISKGETLFFEIIKKLGFSNIEKQYRIFDVKKLKNYFVDIYLPDYNTLIEIDGDFKWDLKHHLLFPWKERSDRIKDITHMKLLHILTDDAYYYKDHPLELKDIILNKNGEIPFKTKIYINEKFIIESLKYFAKIDITQNEDLKRKVFNNV